MLYISPTIQGPVQQCCDLQVTGSGKNVLQCCSLYLVLGAGVGSVQRATVWSCSATILAKMLGPSIALLQQTFPVHFPHDNKHSFPLPLSPCSMLMGALKTAQGEPTLKGGHGGPTRYDPNCSSYIILLWCPSPHCVLPLLIFCIGVWWCFFVNLHMLWDVLLYFLYWWFYILKRVYCVETYVGVFFIDGLIFWDIFNVTYYWILLIGVFYVEMVCALKPLYFYSLMAQHFETYKYIYLCIETYFCILLRWLDMLKHYYYYEMSVIL